MQVEISPAEELRIMRTRAGLQQADLAKAAGVSRQTISAWENGRGEPTISEYRKIAAVCGVTLSPYFDKDLLALVQSNQLRFPDFALPPAKISPGLTLAEIATDGGEGCANENNRTASRMVPTARTPAVLRRGDPVDTHPLPAFGRPA